VVDVDDDVVDADDDIFGFKEEEVFIPREDFAEFTRELEEIVDDTFGLELYFEFIVDFVVLFIVDLEFTLVLETEFVILEFTVPLAIDFVFVVFDLF